MRNPETGEWFRMPDHGPKTPGWLLNDIFFAEGDLAWLESRTPEGLDKPTYERRIVNLRELLADMKYRLEWIRKRKKRRRRKQRRQRS